MYTQASRQYSSLLHLQSSAIARQAQHQAAGRQVAAAAGSAAAAVDGFAATATHPHYTAAMTGKENRFNRLINHQNQIEVEIRHKIIGAYLPLCFLTP